MRIVPLLTAAGMCILGACQAPRPHLSATQQEMARQLGEIDPWKDSRAAATPIVDVHTHTFNARYLPLQGILHGKRDAFAPVTTLISDHCAKVIAEALIDRTELAEVPGQAGIARKPDTRTLRAAGHPGLLCNVFLRLIDKAIVNGAWDSAKSMGRKLEIIDGIAADMNVLERLAVKSAARMMGMEAHSQGGKTVEGTITGNQAAVRFLWTLTQTDAGMAALYRSMHRGAPMKGRITMLSHMMDLGPVYDQSPDGKALLDFQTQQVKRMEYFQGRPDSGLLYFVAYNPYRDHWPDSGASGSLEVVRDAITRHGAKGVKVYPPSGYRATANDIPSRPAAPFTRYPGRQWDARYARLGDDRNKALDAELNTLLEWCIAHDVPVFTHCGYAEFEARKGYGIRNADPVFWEKFLESHSTPGRPCRLRLCLGHAGGGDYWFGTGKNAAWGRRVYDLCTRYPNVYCEITTDESLIRPDTQAVFADTLATLFEESAQAATQPKHSDMRNPFSSKLMYGTDWFLPDKGKPDAVLLATQQAFLHPRLREHYAAYFSGNARRYLKLAPDTPRRITSASGPRTRQPSGQH